MKEFTKYQSTQYVKGEPTNITLYDSREVDPVLNCFYAATVFAKQIADYAMKTPEALLLIPLLGRLQSVSEKALEIYDGAMK